MSVLTLPTRSSSARSGTTAQAEKTTLAQAHSHDVFTISHIHETCDSVLAQRLYDLGFREETQVECIRRAPLGSPIMFRVCDTDICLRASQAKLIHAELN